MPAPSPRRIAGALAVLLALPMPALEALAERLIDRLDALDGNPDAEPDSDDCCDAEDDDPASSRPHRGVSGVRFAPGDPADGEADPWDLHEHHWPPVKGPDGCGVLRLAGAS